MLKPSMRIHSFPVALVESAVLALAGEDVASSDKGSATTDAAIGRHAVKYAF